ncbi:MAG TPA: putative Ig domain-containing protein [Clostridia bacterium]|nr:putative Ig domain-containing protein [Clostridia bacterium]
MIEMKKLAISKISLIVLIIAGLIFPATVGAEEGVNQAPYFTYLEYVETFEIYEGESLPNLQAEDPDGDTITFSVIFGSLPPGITLNDDGSFDGTAGNPTHDAYYVEVEASDGKGGTDTAGLMIIVHPVNDTPEFTGAAANTSQIILVGQGLADLEVYDQDGDTLTFSITSGTLPGGISMNVDGSFTGIADTFSAGTYTVGINVNDGNMGVADTVLVIIVNWLPSFTDAVTNTSQIINEGQGLTALEATDLDGDTLTYSITGGSLPDNVSLSLDGSFSGFVSFSSAGAYSVTAAVYDDNGGADWTALSITVNDVNRSPVFSDAAANTNQTILAGQGLTALEATDPDRDTLTYSVISGVLPDCITLNSNGSFSGTTSTSPAGLYTIVIGVSDSKGGTDQTELVITVTRPSGRDDDDDEDDSPDSNNNSGNNTSNGTSNNDGLSVIQPDSPSHVPGVVFSDQQAAGVNKPVAQIQQELQQAGIKDVKPTDWFAGSVTVLVQSGLLGPDTDGNFHPEANVSLEEGISVFAKVLGIAAKDDAPSQAVAKMQEAGLMGTGTGASQDMSRLEFTRLMGQALGVETNAIISRDQYPFADFDSVTPEERGFIKAMYDLGIIKGYLNDGIRTFNPNEILTRAQLAILVDRILGTHQ